jgi:putative redox protein
MASISGTIGRDHYRMQLQTPAGHLLTADEPEDLGGTNLGPAPDELLCAALASCATITMRMYADRKQWALDSIDMEVSLERLEDNSTAMVKKVTFHGALSAEEQQRLLQIGDKCPVHKTLSNPIRIQSVIIS